MRIFLLSDTLHVTKYFKKCVFCIKWGYQIHQQVCKNFVREKLYKIIIIKNTGKKNAKLDFPVLCPTQRADRRRDRVQFTMFTLYNITVKPSKAIKHLINMKISGIAGAMNIQIGRGREEGVLRAQHTHTQCLHVSQWPGSFSPTAQTSKSERERDCTHRNLINMDLRLREGAWYNNKGHRHERARSNGSSSNGGCRLQVTSD